MKLLILGASGGVGLEVVNQALQRGHDVTAFVRSPKTLARYEKFANIVEGNLLDSGDLARVAQGHDAVLSSFGPRDPREKDSLLESFGGALTTAMRDANVRRLIVVSVAFLFKNSILPPAYLLGRLLFPHLVEDAARMELLVMRSRLDWTIVRPPQLTNRANNGAYRIREGHLPSFGFAISRGEVANFMLKAVEQHSYAGKVVGISR